MLAAEDRRLLELLAEGKDTRQIARAFAASDSTIKRSIRRVQMNLGAINRVQAVYIATKKGLI